MRYALLMSLRNQEQDVDQYTPISVQITTRIAAEVSIWSSHAGAGQLSRGNAASLRLILGDITVRQPRNPRSNKIDMSYAVRPYNNFGPAFIKVCTYCPWPIKARVNGHEWARRQTDQARQRKHRIAEEHLATHEITEITGPGVFLVLVAKATATVWKVKRSAKGAITNLEKKTEYVNHCSFHVMDPDWGHVTIKMSGRPPFGAQIVLNGHEFVACQARRAGIAFGKDGNCFTAGG